jgi:hypothetical protein
MARLKGTDFAVSKRMANAAIARILSGFLLGALSASACGDSTPAAPTPPETTVNGKWVGTLPVQEVTAEMTWTLTQSSGAVTGPALVLLPSGVVLLNGSLVGTLAGSVLSYTIAVSPGGIPAQPTCAGQMAGTMTVSLSVTSTMTGPMAVTSSNCSPPFAGGTVTLTKQ